MTSNQMHFQKWPPQAEHIFQLAEAETPEGPCLDFKQDFIKPEKLRERVCAFANGSGGEFVFGIIEHNGVAAKVVPITLDDAPDRKEITLREIIRGGIHPQIPGVEIAAIPVQSEGQSGHGVVIRVPKSWVGPHMVVEKKQIYIRESTQSRPMEYHEQAILHPEHVLNESFLISTALRAFCWKSI